MSKRENSHRSRGVTLGLDYEVEVRDKDGKLISKLGRRPDPFTRAWIRALRTAALGGVSTVSLTDTAGSARTFTFSETGAEYFDITGGATEDTHGIVVGNSDVAFDKAQSKLEGKIANGSGGGQLVYGAQTTEDYADEDSTTRFRMIRGFTNNSGAPVTVKEIGIVLRNNKAGAIWYLLVARDVLASPQTVPDGATLTVRYRVYISYA